jgi:hypothetical protein
VAEHTLLVHRGGNGGVGHVQRVDYWKCRVSRCRISKGVKLAYNIIDHNISQ